MSYIIRNNTLIAKTVEHVKSGTDINYAYDYLVDSFRQQKTLHNRRKME